MSRHEIENRCKIHLSWNENKILVNQNNDKRIISIQHPWIKYRIDKNYRPSPVARGTVVFVPHTTQDVKIKNMKPSQFFEQYTSLDKKYLPTTFCFHYNDINSDIYKYAQLQGFKIISAGNPLNLEFVDRFYDMLSNFRYATSPDYGSQVTYCLEFGLRYFFFGEKSQYVNISDINLPKGLFVEYRDKYHKEYLIKFKKYLDIQIFEEKFFEAHKLSKKIMNTNKIDDLNLKNILLLEFMKSNLNLGNFLRNFLYTATYFIKLPKFLR